MYKLGAVRNAGVVTLTLRSVITRKALCLRVYYFYAQFIIIEQIHMIE